MKAMVRILLLLLLLILYCVDVKSFATFLTGEHCDRQIENGVLMMGNPVEPSDKRKIRVLNEKGEELVSGSTVTSIAGLTIDLQPRITQAVLEVRSPFVQFQDGKCGGNRVTHKGELEYIAGKEADAKGEVKIVAVFGSASSVRQTDPFILNLATSSSEL